MDFIGIKCPGDDRPCSLAGLAALTSRLVEAIPFSSATVDGFTDCRDVPGPALEGLAYLERVAAEKHRRDAQASRWYRWLRRKGPTNMAIEFDLRDQSARAFVAAFAPYSIHAQFRDRTGTVELVLHDSGGGVSVSADRAHDEALVARILEEAGADSRRS